MKVVNVHSVPVGFCSGKLAGNELKKENGIVNETSIPKQKSKTKKILLGLGALATLGLAGVLCMKRGKMPVIKPSVDDLASGKSAEHAVTEMTDEARRIYDDIKSGYRDVVDADWVDEQFLGKNRELDRLNNYYRDLEEEQLENERIGQRIKGIVDRKLHKPQELDSHLGETIDGRLESKNMPSDVRDEMTKFYTEMEEKAQIAAEKQAKKEAMLKLKAENPEEYARLKAEQRRLKKAERAKVRAEQLAQNTSIITRADGVTLKKVVQTDKSGNTLIRLYSEKTGKLLSETRIEPNAGGITSKSTTTIYDGRRRLTRIVDGSTEITKVYVKGKNGKFKLLERNICDDLARESKLVRRMANGNFEIIEENTKSITRIIRDKKGNIISKDVFNKCSGPTPPPAEPPKVLAAWYKNYLALCKEFGVSPRACGKYGAWDHFYELSLRKNDPQAYEHYLRNREYRARMGYNERAVVLDALDNNKIRPDFIEILKAKFPKADIGEIILQISESLKQAGESPKMTMEYLNKFLRAIESGKLDASILENLEDANLEKKIGNMVVKELMRLEQEAAEAARLSARSSYDEVYTQPQVIMLNA